MSKYLRKNSQLVKTLTDHEDAKFNLSWFIEYLTQQRSHNILESEHRIDQRGVGDGDITFMNTKLANDLLAFHQLITDKEVYSSVWDKASKFPNQTVYRYSVGFSYDGFIKEASLILNESLEDIFEDFKKIYK